MSRIGMFVERSFLVPGFAETVKNMFVELESHAQPKTFLGIAALVEVLIVEAGDVVTDADEQVVADEVAYFGAKTVLDAGAFTAKEGAGVHANTPAFGDVVADACGNEVGGVDVGGTAPIFQCEFGGIAAADC